MISLVRKEVKSFSRIIEFMTNALSLLPQTYALATSLLAPCYTISIIAPFTSKDSCKWIRTITQQIAAILKSPISCQVAMMPTIRTY